MNFTIEFRDGQWVLLSKDGEVLASNEDKAVVLARLADFVNESMIELAAVADQISDEAKGARFEMVFEEGERSIDNRIIDENATQFDRPVPLPAMFMTENPEFGGHAGAKLGGVIDEVERTGGKVVLRGHFDAGSDNGVEFERLVNDGVLSWWSPDFAPDGEVDIECMEEDDDGFCIDFLLHLVKGTIIGGTACPFQALNSARIRIIEGGGAAAPEADAEEASVTPITAGVFPASPPAAWFEDPAFGDPEQDDRLVEFPNHPGTYACPLTITDEGRVFGHLAAWNTCHIGIEGACVTAPHSATDYAYFHTGAIHADGCDCEIPVGQITMGADHDMDLTDDFRAASAHYANNAVAVADIVIGDDRYGPWVAGAMRPGVTEEQVRALRASALSGDWRPVGNGLELVAALAVNVPGFGIPRARARLASGRALAMVAAGAAAMATLRDPERRWRSDIEKRIDLLERVTKPLVPTALRAARDRAGTRSA